MTAYVITADFIPGDNLAGIVFGGNGDSLYVSAGVSIITSGTTFNRAIGVIAGTLNYVTVAGEVRGALDGIAFTSGDGVVDILEGGTVSGQFSGIFYAATGSLRLNNAGQISSLQGDGVYCRPGAVIANSGTISARDTALYIAGPVSGVANVQNSGTIAGATVAGIQSNAALNLTNSGTIGGDAGVYANAGGTVINLGTISATAGSGIVGAQIGITNSGTISGTANGLSLVQSIVTNSGIIFGGQSGIKVTGALTLTNTGTISGVTAALSLASFADIVVNRGTLVGNVNMGDADDLFDGTGGTVLGRIDLGIGDDTATGGSGSDTFVNGTVSVSDGNDSIDAGGGLDTLDVASSGAGVRIDLVRGTARGAFLGSDTVAGFEKVIATGFDDRLIAANVATTLLAGNGNDVLTGGGKDDVLAGGGGIDTLFGNSGNDRLNGGAGADSLNGGKGTDLLIGGADADVLTGGASADTFVFNARADFLNGGTGPLIDRISDFEVGLDLIDLSGVDANAVTGGDQDFAFVGTGAFSASGQVRVVTAGTVTTVWICDNFAAAPAGVAALTLTGVTAVTAADFVL